MILEALCRLAEQDELVGDPDYEMRPVGWLVTVGEDGRLVSVQGTHVTPETTGKKKPKPLARSYPVPRQPTRTSGDLAFFLCDKAEYAVGMDPTPEEGKRRPPEKVAVRFGLFRDQVHACAEATKDEGARAVAAFLDNLAEGREYLTLEKECGPGELFAFVYRPDVDRLVHSRPAVRAYWKAQRSQSGEGTAAERHRCIVTGEPMDEAGLFPQLKRVPGGNPSGVALVSFNATAFESHGWRSNENAPISRDAAEAAATALNRLLHPAYPDPRPETLGQPLPLRNVRLGTGTVTCYWSEEKDGGLADFFASIVEAEDPERVGEAYRSLWTGREVPIRDPSAFYALTLSGAQGRAMVRDWFESTVADVTASLARYFDDLSIVRNAQPAKGKEPSPALPLRVLLASLAPLGRADDVPAALSAALVRTALGGAPTFPNGLLVKALERARAEFGRTEWADLQRRDARAALIKAVLRRNFHMELTPHMDPTNDAPGYLLGRLLAVLERLQQIALGDVNATVVDRFFGAASATPQAVFPRLLKNARHHARKAADSDTHGGTAMWLDKQIDEICAKLDVQKNVSGIPYTGFPSHLSLNEQGLFVLGYHQQRHWLWLKKEDREKLQAGEPAVPA